MKNQDKVGEYDVRMPDLVKGARKYVDDAMERREWEKTGGPPQESDSEVYKGSPMMPMTREIVGKKYPKMKPLPEPVEVIRGMKREIDLPKRKKAALSEKASPTWWAKRARR